MLSVQCPKCSAEIEQDFGLINCPNCQSLLSIDVDGRVILGENNETHEETPNQISEEVFEPVNHFQMDNPVSSDEPFASDLNNFPNEPFTRDTTEQLESHPILEAEVEHFSEPHTESTQSIVSDLKKFGNSEVKSSAISYDVKVSDINLAETRADVLFQLSDSRFGFDLNEVNSNIKNGELVLENLNPAQAVMVIRRLQNIKVKIEWSQKLYA